MEKYTWQKPDGEFGLYGYDIREVPKALYGAIYKLKDYEQIGTVVECLEAREKQEPQKFVKDNYNHDCCPVCGCIVLIDCYTRGTQYCINCGQAIKE